MRTFGSDNYSGVHPRIMQELASINVQGHDQPYGGDAVTAAAAERFRDAFGDVRVVFTPSGTGANVLALALLRAHRYDAVICAGSAHVFEEEAGAVAATLGMQMFPVAHRHGKIAPHDLRAELQRRADLGFHSPRAGVVTIANTTEYGAVYRPDEVREIAGICRDFGAYLHVDGTRLANAAAALGVQLRELTVDAGVDVFTFGGAKNGLLNAESIVVARAPETDLSRAQKNLMQLPSKMRYLSGQFVPYLAEGIWRDNAAHSNALAQTLAEGLVRRLGPDSLTHPVETNQVFCLVPAKTRARLEAAGHRLYDWDEPDEVRFAVSWDNTEEDVAAVLDLIGAPDRPRSRSGAKGPGTADRSATTRPGRRTQAKKVS
jgi:threonine aldolase